MVTAVTAATFTATFTRAHNGAAAAFQIAGRADERLRVNMRVIRYLKPTVAVGHSVKGSAGHPTPIRRSHRALVSIRSSD